MAKLPESERKRLWYEVAKIWDIGRGVWWHPLGETSRTDVIAFEVTDFDAAIGVNGLKDILARHQVSQVWYFPEFDEVPAQLMDLSDAEFRYTRSTEGYWCDSHWDWLIYASHEESITLGGDWLIAEVKRLWPQWEGHLWRTGG